jgi:hypothetical protein
VARRRLTDRARPLPARNGGTIYRLELELRGLPPLQIAGARGHWATRWRKQARWKRDVATLAAFQRPPAPLERARVTLVRCCPSEPDPDNLAASFKPLLDGLVEARVLAGDTPDHFEGRRPTYGWEPAPARAGSVRLIVEAI